ncbi:PQQ-binding-like beta-propeller repeat protein [Anaeromyxobacter dehalogenans]|uniref:WD-40 repeat-containing protein n=1 Tax=Anaeromyxobacter dehalogenans (strain 2CP-C) TaxID=290397 RepID=Q2IID0_ANADE|nr:PQQ-binding-like beta-propeller repeat protein [Anaeromyxobacter dehalogenans]ABC81407.1 WD-40 repeat-containing protein [Anaeromyxobacter dehalogenans 2CP-C]
MIRIRTGTSWRLDPDLTAALRRAAGPARTAATRAIVDALAIEVDGIDIAGGRAEGPLLPSLEALLRAVARVVGGAPHAAVAFHEGALELVLRRRGGSALLTLVSLARPSRVLARDVEVDLEALAAAALEAAAELCRELAEAAPAAARDAGRLRAAARDLRRTEAAPAPGPRPPVRARRPGPAPRPGRVACTVDLADDEGVLLAYPGGRPDLGSLLAPGVVRVVAEDGAELLALQGFPFLALRDLVAAAGAIVGAVRRREPALEVPLSRAGRAPARTLELDLAAGRVRAGGVARPAPPLALARAVAEAALDLCRLARARNPRQSENAYLAELEAAAAERLAQVEELAGGDLSAGPSAGQARARGAAIAAGAPLGPGRLRRLSFRRAWSVDVGAPAGPGLWNAGALTLAAGAEAVVAVDRARGEVAWRAAGGLRAAPLPGAVLVIGPGRLEALALRTGRPRWARTPPGADPEGAVALAGGPLVLVEPGALTGLEAATGRTLWRLELPGRPRLRAAAFGGVAVAASDAGFVYAVDAAGRLAWRVRAPGAPCCAPSAGRGACLVLAEAGAGTALLALDPSTGARRWEAPLDLVPAGPPIAWGPRLAVVGTVGGDPAVTALRDDGSADWTDAPPLTGAPAAAAAGPLLVLRDAAGALVALGRDGAVRWSRAAPPGHLPPGAAAPAVARGTLLVPGEGIACLALRTGEPVGAIPAVAPARLAVDGALRVAAMDLDGLTTGFRLATHLSVV